MRHECSLADYFCLDGFAHYACEVEDSKVRIVYYDEADFEGAYDARYPFYKLRGKPIPVPLARKIIRLTSSPTDIYNAYLNKLKLGPPRKKPWLGIQPFIDAGLDYTYTFHGAGYFDNNWFPTPDKVCHGWCHPDGYIGEDYFTAKIPFFADYIDIWDYLITEVTQELDLVIAITDQEEHEHHHLNFLDTIRAGMHIYGNTVELLGPAKARLLFKKYDRLYGEHEKNGPLRDIRTKNYPLITDWKTLGDFGCVGGGDLITVAMQLKPEDFLKRDYELVELFAGRHLDKNNHYYYGVPDYTLQEGPLTLEDLKLFAQEFKAEQTRSAALQP